MGISFSGLASGLDTQSIVNDLMKIERMKVDKVSKEKTLLEWKKDAWEETNTTLFSFYKNELFSFKSSSTYMKKSATSSNESLVPITNASSAPKGVHNIEVVSMATGSHLSGSQISDPSGTEVTSSTKIADLVTFATGEVKTISVSLDGGATTKEVSINENDTIQTVSDKFKALDMEMTVSFDDNYDRFFLSSKNTGSGVTINMASTHDDLLNALGFDSSNRTGSAGTDAEFIYNGTNLTSSKNEVSVNGLTFNILADSGTSTINVNQDTEAIYDKVKEFIGKYNEILDLIDKKVSAKSARAYKPLTNEEKKAMTEKDIELWENKIKDSLLRRDGTLDGVRNTMRNTLTANDGVDVSSLKIKSLSELGIISANYKEKGKLHIQGDSDDNYYATDENKLRKAIEEDPEAVEELLTALGESLYDKMGKMMKSTSNSSALKFYDDKMMTKGVADYQIRIFKLEEKMDVIEQRYYRQFTAMEQAIQQSNATGEWLTGQLSGLF